MRRWGITGVFNKDKADLGNLAPGSYINTAKHKAEIEFTNEGIKAAAATAVGGFGNANGGFKYDFEIPVKKIDMTFNRPYMYIIRDKDTNEVWFAGTVYTPNYEPEYEEY